MIEPEAYGFNDVQTFAHIGDPSPAPDHSVFWKHWYARFIEDQPNLSVRSVTDDSDPTATHEFISSDGVRIGCRLVLPEDGKPVKASLVTAHGYHHALLLGDSIKRWQRIADSGVAVLIVRLRGYPGSQIGIGDQTTPDELGAGWIARGFAGKAHEDWILPKAVADVCNACRVMRNALLQSRHRGPDRCRSEHRATRACFLARDIAGRRLIADDRRGPTHRASQR